jgi:hypothetical protein
MSRPFDELKTIAATWATLTRDPNPPQNDLAIAVYHTMVDRSAMRAVWENLDPEARAFIVWLLGQRNMLALVDDLPGHLNQPPEEVTPLLERTRRAGLVDVDEVLVRGSRVVSSGDNLYAWAGKNQTEAVRRRVVSIAAEAARVLREILEESKSPTPFEESFSALLNRLEQEEVQRIAATWKLPETSRYYKSELVGVMSEFVATGQGRNLLLTALPQHSQSLFTYLESNEGQASAAQVKSHFGWAERDMRLAMLPLVQRALVWDVISESRRYLFIPCDLKRGSQPSLSKVTPLSQPKIETSAPYSHETRLPYEMSWDLLTLLASAGQQELSLTLQDGRITKRHAKKLNDAFLHPTDLKAGTDYIDVLVHLARTLGLLSESQGERSTLVTTPKVEEWVNLSFDAQRRRLYGLWQEDRKWAEPATYGTIYWWNSDLTGARKRLAHHLVELPPMQWVSVDAFLRRIHTVEPFLIWSQDELVGRFGLRALQGFRSQWFEIEGRIIADMLRTMLFWLGALDIGRDKPKRFVSFRLTEEAIHLLSNTSALGNEVQNPKSKIQNPKSLLIQPNFEVLVLAPESRTVWDLVRIADLVRHDRVSVYVLNKDSVLRGVEEGMSPEAIKHFLETNSGKGLPQNIAHSIDDWSRLAKRIGIGQFTLVEVEDASLLDEMMASRKTRKYITRRLSPTAAIANLSALAEGGREDTLQKLMRELRSAGYFPRISASEESPRKEEIAERPPQGAVRSITDHKAPSGRARSQSKVEDTSPGEGKASKSKMRTGTS